MIDNFNIFMLSDMAENCYAFTDRKTGTLAVVDPGAYSTELIDWIKKLGGKIEIILLTHGHFDHMGYALELKRKFGGKIVISAEETDFLKDNSLNLSVLFGNPLEPFSADIILNDGSSVKLGETNIEFMHTPGHTRGSGCYIVGEYIFSGDTLFRNSIGRTDLPTGDHDEIIRSLKKLGALNGDYKVFSGHGMSTTLEYERKNNPYMNGGRTLWI